MERSGTTPWAWRLAWLAWGLALCAIAYLFAQVRQLERLQGAWQAPSQQSPMVVPRGDLSSLERSTVELFQVASQSVVHITTVDLLGDPLRLRAVEVPRGSGSGFFWDRQGHVVTNLHVIESAKAARVTLPDHSVWPAQLVGVSRRNDLAVLHVEGAGAAAHPLQVGTSNDLVVGQSVAAIGSPFGLDHTLSVGIVSGLGREIPGPSDLPIRDVIQTDAAINPGNSGGPLLDSSGRLVGVNTAILSPSGASAGIGFAVPVDTVARVVPQLIRFHREIRPVLGVELAHDSVVRRLGLRGALILHVAPGSPAAEAGLQPTVRDGLGRIRLGDRIVEFDRTKIDGATDLYAALDRKQPGDAVRLEVWRGDASLSLELRVAANVDVENAD